MILPFPNDMISVKLNWSPVSCSRILFMSVMSNSSTWISNSSLNVATSSVVILSMRSTYKPLDYSMRSCESVPTNLNSPCFMIAKLSASASASSMECVVMTTLESVLNFLIEFHMNLLASGSIPVLGSSSKIAFGFPISAHATINLRLLPPENRPARLSPFIFKFMLLIKSSTLLTSVAESRYFNLP